MAEGTRAEDAAVNAAIDAGLRHWGPRWAGDILQSRDAMLRLYEPLLRASGVRRRQAGQAIAYGPHARQVMDVFVPDRAQRAPLLVFVHGGAFVRGERDLSPYVHANVAAEFAAHGYVAASVGYRLAPQAAWPEGARDVLAAMAWLRSHAAWFGADPHRMFLMGHSAGCAHCATAAWDARASGTPPDLAGLILVSPRLRIDLGDANPNRGGVLAYYGADPAAPADRAPLSRLTLRTPVLVVSAGYENPGLHQDVEELQAQAAGPGQDARRLTRLHFPEHNHVSIVAQFNTHLNRLGTQIRDWCEDK